MLYSISLVIFIAMYFIFIIIIFFLSINIMLLLFMLYSTIKVTNKPLRAGYQFIILYFLFVLYVCTMSL